LPWGALLAVSLLMGPRPAAAKEPAARLGQAAARVPRAQWLPSVGGTAQIVGATVNNSTATVLSNPRVDLPRIGATRISPEPDLKPYASTLVAVGVRQELFDFGRIAAQTAALDAQAEARFKAGLGTVLELVDAEALRVEAEVQRAVGGFGAARARALLERSVAEAK
jgi:outer membrane protein